MPPVKRSEETEERDETTPPPSWTVVSQWPTATRAAAKLGVSQRRFAAMVRDGSVVGVRAKDATTRFNPIELDALKAELDDAEQEEAVEETKARIDFLRQQNEALKETRAYALRMTELIAGPIELGMKHLAEQSRLAGERIARLESLQDEMVMRREDYLSQKAERDMMATALQESEKRKTEIFGQMMKSAPRLMTQIEATLTGGAGRKLETANRFMASLDPDMVRMLMSLDFLTPAQKHDLEQILPAETLAKVRAAIAAEKENENGTSRSDGGAKAD